LMPTAVLGSLIGTFPSTAQLRSWREVNP
jgi:hypothetical protein